MLLDVNYPACHPDEACSLTALRAKPSIAPAINTLDVTRIYCYLQRCDSRYRDQRTRAFANGKWVKAFSGFERAARMKLDRLEAAVSPCDLAALPGNRFESLRGDRKGQHSSA